MRAPSGLSDATLPPGGDAAPDCRRHSLRPGMACDLGRLMRTAAGNFMRRKRDPLVGERAELSQRYVCRNQEEGMYYLQMSRTMSYLWYCDLIQTNPT